MYVVALTGGIGSGKSEASKHFARLGVPVVDTDIIAHALTAINSPFLKDIRHAFGDDFLNKDGALNRTKLRQHIFNNFSEKKKLEQLLHPAIHAQALETLATNQESLHPKYQLLVVPLLFESNRYQSIASTSLVIDCDEALQISRAMARSQLTADEVKGMIRLQIPRVMRLSLADTIIENNGSVDELNEKINEFHKKLIKTCIVSK